jgi:hypothetical protein
VSSYRITLVLGDLVPGVAPESVLPAAADAARVRVTVEASDVAVVRGEARITVRFTADDDGQAVDVARRVRAVVSGLVDVSSPRLTRRYGARWYRVAQV